MFVPSDYLKRSVSHCGAPARAFLKGVEERGGPPGILHPTIRRIDWRAAVEDHECKVPSPGSDLVEDLERNRAEVVAWAIAAWRGCLAPQLEEIVRAAGSDRDGRECHPYAFGYVRGVAEALVDAGALGDRPVLRGFVRIGALVDVWGLDWVDDIDEAISELAAGRHGEDDMRDFHEGADDGMAEMERCLGGVGPAPRKLCLWYEANARTVRRGTRRSSRIGFSAQAAIAELRAMRPDGDVPEGGAR